MTDILEKNVKFVMKPSPHTLLLNISKPARFIPNSSTNPLMGIINVPYAIEKDPKEVHYIIT